jgi:M6 family metalloprotease-like protein
MKNYYEEVSYGKFSVSAGPGGIAGWYTASKNHNYYGSNSNSTKYGWAGTLVREAVAAADPSFNFAPYDLDGDCYVDVVSIVHQGLGEESANANVSDIWSHSSTLNNEYPYNSNAGEYTTNDVCPAGGFIRVNAYVIQPETYSSGQSTMGVYAHEFGHALGLPDLYDTTSASRGIGSWSLMAYGSWNGITRNGDTPAQLDAWSKAKLGWISPIQLNATSSLPIKEVEHNKDVYQLLNNPNGVTDWTRTGTGKGEYFLIENRRKIGFDAALPGEGLLIWHIDESMGGNTNKSHKLVDLEEADGLNHLDTFGLNKGDAFDPWYNSTIGFTQATTPNSKLYNGSVSGVRVTNIGASATTMNATLGVSAVNSRLKGGVIRNTNMWLLDASGNGAYGAGDLVYTFGKSGDIPVTGDWNKDGKTEIGVVRNTNLWLLDASGNGAYGAGDLAYTFGKSGDIPVTGDWNNDGKTEIGVVRNGNTWLLDASGNGAYGAGDLAYTFGKAGDVPVTGDWNADSKTEIGVFRNSNTWLLDASGNGAYGARDLAYTFGKAGDKPVTGKWS